jgi:hypothetical protein
MTERWQSRGARALVFLHERSMNEFVAAWSRARGRGVELADGSSLDELFEHVLRWGRWYLTWVSTTIGKSDHPLAGPPSVAAMEAEGERYLAELLAAYRVHLSSVTDSERGLEAAVPWGPTYCVDALLEHALVHPQRHRFVLEELLARSPRVDDMPRTDRPDAFKASQ